MLKFVKNYMDSIEGVAIYPMISLLIFFVFFGLLLWWVLTASKNYLDQMSKLPLDENEPTKDHSI
ncbi:CcoQ/FixQ family Cbb3-type cytochrome c oxidase assembly chaperone [Flavobacteriaceae bacterium F89]|uniref:CcoQ/FixQ family Cbb3-type cytochrome c oxidase assembly chaperone n=1 Tax=Cerina litoralis TaxID=2874477 RepID=A0AAE3ESG2_9FLAO|nr:CcoQ/FixQ family Cbb3-type cytochrome c oxidase assembly chaperone [Cerina litoralis]MCG2460235.1 CcoQ/FixQ family Cbb3-type cytochrome c oxidase assembly chaperone [Cerina litoralis]